MDQKVKPTPRLAPLAIDHTPELKESFEASAKALGFVPNSMLIMQRKPKLVKALAQLTAAVWDPQGEVERGFKRLLAHVASRAAGCRYCMAHTAVIATFGFLNRWNDTMATPLEAEPIAVGEKFLAPHGWSAGKHAR